MRKRKKSILNTRPRRLLLVLALVVLAAATYLTFRNDPANNGSAATSSSTPSQTSTQASSEKSSQHQSSSAQGGAVDNKGSDVTQTPSSEWTSSDSGIISLYSPAEGATLRSGDNISGSASVGEVQYRLVDKQIGLLAQGSLSVVKGKYSGKLQFKPGSSSGKLEVFSFNSSGAEINRLEVNVKMEP